MLAIIKKAYTIWCNSHKRGVNTTEEFVLRRVAKEMRKAFELMEPDREYKKRADQDTTIEKYVPFRSEYNSRSKIDDLFREIPE